ncbi:MAG: ABC transporter ATP-binding protein [Caldilineales bacterium]|nr:ABC transporter ATP-binding protein [Caldilineales bacterium]MDW8318664.1 ABC transporter ATP-binding protein [Anaerolineae bacterium]
MLVISHLTKRFGNRTVLDDLSLEVQAGEFFVLLGPSGSGKSTLLRILSGIERADAGDVRLNGRDLLALPPRERNLGMVFQDYGLYPHMNAYQNIAYGLEARGLPRAEVDARVREAAARLGLTDLLNRNVNDLSGGEQQRVALARVLARDADLCLFDEPISNLDPKLRSQARRDIQMLHRLKGKPTLYVTHDQNEALALADRLAVLHNGRLQQVGRPEELLTRPANVFVAGFLGSPPMNLLQGRLRREVETLYADLGPGLSLQLPRAPAGYGKAEVIVGIPPTALYAPGQPLPDEAIPAGPLIGVIADLEPLIGEAVVALRLPGDRTLAALFRNVDETQFQPGEPLAVTVDAAALCFFDPDTGEAVVTGDR